MIALTAIKAAMENIGEDFNKYKAYVYLVRRYLLQNLLQNFISNNMEVVEVSALAGEETMMRMTASGRTAVLRRLTGYSNRCADREEFNE